MLSPLPVALRQYSRRIALLVLLSCLANGCATSSASKAQYDQWFKLTVKIASLADQGRNDDALSIANQALDLAQRNFGPNSLNVASTLDLLASVEVRQAAYDKAEPAFRRELAIREQILGPDHPDVASALDSLGVLYRDQHEFAKAELLLMRSLKIREKRFGEGHFEVTASLNALGFLYQQWSRYGQAQGFFERSLAIREKTRGAFSAEAADAVNNLALLYVLEAKYAKAEPLLLRLISIMEKIYGPVHQQVAVALNNLASLYISRGQYAKAEALMLRTVAISEKTMGSENPDVAVRLMNLAAIYEEQAQYARAEPLLTRALTVLEKSYGPDNRVVASCLDSLAQLYELQGQYPKSEALMVRELAIRDSALGPDHPDVADTLGNLALLYELRGQFSSAEPLFLRQLAIREKIFGPDHPAVADSLHVLSSLYIDEKRYAEVAPLETRAISIWQKAFGPNYHNIASALINLASVDQAQGRFSEAEIGHRRALGLLETTLGTENVRVATELDQFAQLYQAEGKFSKADPLYRRALAIRQAGFGALNVLTGRVRFNLAVNDEAAGNLDEAIENFRQACPTLSAVAATRDQDSESVIFVRDQAATCWMRLSLALQSLPDRTAAALTQYDPSLIGAEAFLASQRAQQSAAADALAHSGALAAASSLSAGPIAEAYEAAVIERSNLDQQYAAGAAATDEAGIAKREALGKARGELRGRIQELESQLQSKAPRYWDYRSPEPLSVSALQAQAGAESTLLHGDEALVLFLIAPGRAEGQVFAITKEREAWARVTLSGDELTSRIIALRSQIDPYGYGVRGFKEEGGAPRSGIHPTGFDRKAAYELYEALLGDPSIQAVVREKPTLLWVPSGPLSSLPPGILVTRAPVGGIKGDTDAQTLRRTPWLLRSKALALLPTVSSLRTLRQIRAGARPVPSDPLLVFADPDFGDTAADGTAARGVVRGLSTYYHEGTPLAASLAALPALPGTKIEGESLVRALHASPQSLLTGSRASKSELLSRNRDGRLEQVRVLEFATHGLIAGDVSELAEPALVLAAGTNPQDELLRASEAATLSLNADWVLLSACNTASPDSPGAQGLSGLARAFFYAGASSLLVSHWRVRDDVAARLVPNMLLRKYNHPNISRAQALREASLAILDDPTLHAANPAAWAPFTLIGEAGR